MISKISGFFLAACLLLIVGINRSYAQSEVPRLSNPVTDKADILSPQAERQLNALLQKWRQEERVQMAVLTVPSLGGDAIESFSIRVVEQWKLGDAESDKGLLLLVAPRDRQLRIEVGQGLEGDLPDAFAKRIIDYQILPFFKRGDFEGGVFAGVLGSMKHVSPTFAKSILNDTQLQQRVQEGARSKQRSPSLWHVLIVLFLLFFRFGFGGLFFGGMGYRSRGGFGGGGFGGFSGGGGGFSGGGASGSW